jgi:orotidine-5'-phosphate decarboxylase
MPLVSKPATFAERFAAAVAANCSHLCVGIDPVAERIPGGDVLGWVKAVVEATSDLVCCYKPNSAFFEALGRDGWEILCETMALIPADIPVLLDAKRGDIGNTAAAYAAAAFDVLGAGAVTVSPYLGRDSLEPFLSRADRAIFVLCRTTNPGASDLQDLPVLDRDGPRPLYEVVAERCRDWNTAGNVGLVAGATYPAELARVRSICPEQLLLVPGVGTQGGDLEAAVAAARDAQGGGFLVNVSRQITYASGTGGFGTAVRSEAQRLRRAIEAALLA